MTTREQATAELALQLVKAHGAHFSVAISYREGDRPALIIGSATTDDQLTEALLVKALEMIRSQKLERVDRKCD